MRSLFILGLCLVSTATYANQAFDAIPSSAQKMVNTVFKQLRIKDASDKQKMALYQDAAVFLDDEWSGYLVSPTNLNLFRAKTSPVTMIEVVLNTQEHGIVFLDYTYFPSHQQVYVAKKEIRYGDSKSAVAIYQKGKKDTKHMVLLNEGGNRANLKRKGALDYTTLNIDTPNGAVVYNSYSMIDL
ncbi:hypothetical protein ACFODT_00390 [Vibrio zhugei]|uniref:Uncharacterized protein n=1 Tax=Vibrio zhugei TaxID=2479546 RepID=A0ABV7C2U2_9VIBR|nr:hypothetical protein [Vibrio zhugei]